MLLLVHYKEIGCHIEWGTEMLEWCARRCCHYFKFQMQNNVPVVYAREEDTEESPWMGDAQGNGWTIFDVCKPPSFKDVEFEPRVALADFGRYAQRANHFVRKWEEQLAGAGGGDSGREYTNRIGAAVKWWKEFLSAHRSMFRQQTDEATIVVDVPTNRSIGKFVPKTPTEVVPQNSPPLEPKELLR